MGIDKNDFGLAFKNIDEHDFSRLISKFYRLAKKQIYQAFYYYVVLLCVFAVSFVKFKCASKNSYGYLVVMAVSLSGLVNAGSLFSSR